jgi:hypothetical protein
VTLAGKLGGQGLQRIWLAAAQRQARATPGKGLGDRSAQAPGGARKQCCATDKMHPEAKLAAVRSRGVLDTRGGSRVIVCV